MTDDPAVASKSQSGWPARQAEIFRLGLLTLLLGQIFIYYDTATKTIPHINVYLLVSLGLIVLALIPWRPLAGALWALVWPLAGLLHWDWAVRETRSDVFWATMQGADFLLHGRNPYTQVYTWVYQHQPGISNYPSYSYWPGGLFAEIPFYLLGNVRYGLALADVGTGLLIYLLARPKIGIWPARTISAVWLLFLPAFQVPMLLAPLDFLLLFWIALAVWLYRRGWPVASALATAIAISTKQYGILFGVPWGMLLLRPLVLALQTRLRLGTRGAALFRGLRAGTWLPPVTVVAGAALIILPLALLSPRAFLDATVLNHVGYQPDPMLGSPQWDQSIAAQLVALGGLSLGQAATLAALIYPLLVLVILILAVIRTRDAAGALRWSALASGVFFAFNSAQVQFFYWRLVLLLFLLAYLCGPETAAGEYAPTDASAVHTLEGRRLAPDGHAERPGSVKAGK